VPVAFVFHFTVPVHPVAVKIAVSLLHRLILLLAIVGAIGVEPVVITIGADEPLVPQLLLHVAVYVPDVVTMMLAPVAVLLHVTVPKQPLAVKVALAPLHKLLLVVVIDGAVGVLPVLITTGVESALSPQLLLHVAVYVPEMLTVILVPVAFVLHVTVPAQPVAVKVALAPLHKVLLVVAIAGAAGGLPVVIVTMFDTGPAPQMFSHTTL
jgi:hypothetical protein